MFPSWATKRVLLSLITGKTPTRKANACPLPLTHCRMNWEHMRDDPLPLQGGVGR